MQEVSHIYQACNLGDHVPMEDTQAGLMVGDGQQPLTSSSSQEQRSAFSSLRFACEKLQRRLLTTPPELRWESHPTDEFEPLPAWKVAYISMPGVMQCCSTSIAQEQCWVCRSARHALSMLQVLRRWHAWA